MADALPGARLAEIADAGHDVHLDQPERWRAVVQAFLAGLDERSIGPAPIERRGLPRRAASLTLGRGFAVGEIGEACVKSGGPSRADESDRAARANAMQMPSPTPAFGRASLGLVALDSPSWALRRGLASLEGDLPAAIVRVDANATASEVRDASAIARERRRRRRVDSRVRARSRSPRSSRARAPTSCSTRRSAATSSSKSLLGWTSVCDLADLRTDPWRVAIALGSDGDGALDGLDGVDVLGRGADARRLADWLAAGVKVPVWIVGDLPGIQGVRMRFGSHERVDPAARGRAERLARRRARPRRLRARAGARAAGLGRARLRRATDGLGRSSNTCVARPAARSVASMPLTPRSSLESSAGRSRTPSASSRIASTMPGGISLPASTAVRAARARTRALRTA